MITLSFFALAAHADAFKSMKLTEADLPQGYSFSDKLMCKSLQPATFYESVEKTYTSIVGKLKSKSFQSVKNEHDNGSILYFEFEKEFTATGFLEGLLWGGDNATREHPEDYYVNGSILVIWSTLNYSFIKERSQQKIGMDVVLVAQALVAAQKREDRVMTEQLKSYLSASLPDIKPGNLVSAGNTVKYNVMSRKVYTEGFYALMMQKQNNKIVIDAFDPHPSNQEEKDATSSFIEGLKKGTLIESNPIYEYVNGLFGKRELFEATSSNGSLSFSYKEGEKECYVFLRQRDKVIYMASVNKNIFTGSLDFVPFYVVVK